MTFSAFFSGMEIAFVSSNRMLAEMDKSRSSLCQKIISIFYRHPNGFVSTMLVGNNIVLVIYGILIAKLFDNTIFKGMDAGFTVTADTIISTIIILFTGEFLPKSLFKKAVQRNHLRRLMREAYRLHQDLLGEKHYLIAFNYMDKEELSFAVIEKAVCKALKKIAES